MNNKNYFTETHHELKVSFDKNVPALSTTCSSWIVLDDQLKFWIKQLILKQCPSILVICFNSFDDSFMIYNNFACSG